MSTVSSLGNGKFRLSFPEVDGGEYTLSIAEGAFTFLFMERTVNVPALTAYYSVKQYVSAEIMTLAKQMLEKTGVGYPAANSQSRLALKSMVDAAGDNNLGSNNAFIAAIDAFKAETNVEKPASEKFYRIAAVTSTGYVYYLKNNNGRLSLTTNDTDGIVFKATANANGTTVFATIADNAKYLCLPTDGAAFSDVYTAAQNNLTLARLQIEGVDNGQTFGRMSISNGGKFAITDVSALTVLTPRSTLNYGTTETSGFMFFEVNKDEIVEVTQEQFEQLQSMGFVESDEAYEKRRKFIEDIDPQHPSKPTWDSVARENEFWLTLRDSEKIYNDVLIRV